MAGSSAETSRRTLLKATGGVAFAGVSLAALKLPFFSAPPAVQEAGQCIGTDVSETDKRLIISNWPAYIDPKKKPNSTFQVFQQRYGITVDYTDDINDNSEFYAKVKNQLGACQPINRDIMVLTDWMAAKMIGLGWIQPLNADNIPNVHERLIQPLRDRAWDPDLTFHVPWQSGLTGIAYNAKVTGEVGSFEELISRDDLKGRVTLLTEMRDTMAFMLKVVGADPDQFDQSEWESAIERLRQAVSDGHIRSFNGNDYLNDLASGNIAACEAWSGDVIQAAMENPDIKWVVPEEGLSLWSDNMLVPNLATHQTNAELWMNYYYEPEVAAKLAAWNWYICPVEGAEKAMEKVDPSLVGNQLVFPNEETLAKTFSFMALDEETATEYERDWADVQGG
jgi:spermidine/putrescine transport system substrate-binding protein